ncbi:hypothetical protein EMIHUDRAFT_106949 [Emiliania huxleyi CCMP1516]|uniref:Uncharacterized protein n=2 Tax=Emiliania huxleyi TaxID=2903 RepID=A0A0D3I4C0_EMIH1|nr:hypothetical protein EMIHUDRAFT_106949 [Emiliania huxleyi CCMP1516]EOD06105.1 hypothetical protein EMIHUDRAFT_106949 [Emiliania huxleyi CCMP1516]|eukprot:XP_005758534.1 hypothetical protein EMIHUDRAFT_106949 [Emiliania huxleyi CCMP1516]
MRFASGLLILLSTLLVPLLVLPLAVVFAPVAISFVATLFTPWIALGLSGSSDADWLRWRSFPLVVPMVLFVDLPLALYLLVATTIVDILFLQPLVLLAYEAAVLLFRRKTHLPSADDAEAPRPRRVPSADDAEAPRPRCVPSADDAEAPRPRRVPAAASEGDHAPAASDKGAKYRDHASVWAALEGDANVRAGDVRLLSLKWLMALADKGGALPRRQELPEEAFVTAEQLRRIEAGARRGFDTREYSKLLQRMFADYTFSTELELMASLFRRKRNVDELLPIVSISYCWLEAAHPDREGRQLQLLSRKLRSLYGGRGLLGACRDYGFSDMGVFLDWGSGYQKDPALWRAWMSLPALYSMSDDELRRVDSEWIVDERHSHEALAEGAVYAMSEETLHSMADGERLVAERRAYEQSRTGEQKAAFGRMLHHTMDLWYAHAAVTVVLLTQLPDELPAGLFSAGWKLVIDVADEAGGAKMRLPATPARMEALLAKCRFTNGADKGTVLALYEQTAAAILGSLDKLSVAGLPLVRGDVWCSPSRLAEALNYCSSLRAVAVVGARLDDDGVAELVAGLKDGALPALEVLALGHNRYGARGVEAICGVFRRGVAPRLQNLSFAFMPIGDAGAAAVAAAVATGAALPPRLAVTMVLCDVGDEGARSIAAALSLAGPGCRFQLMFNRIGVAGKSAVLAALEARQGWAAFSHMFNLIQMRYAPGSAMLTRAMGRGGHISSALMGQSGSYTRQ